MQNSLKWLIYILEGIGSLYFFYFLLGGLSVYELYTGGAAVISSIGAIATVFVFYSTVQATKNAIKSVEIAEKNLRESREYNEETLRIAEKNLRELKNYNEETIEIAEESLQSSLESSRKDDFIKQFTLLLEQHNRSHDALAKSIDSNDGQLISDSSSFIQWDMTLEEASKKLFQHYLYSPYMRILYRNLKYINENFYLESDDNKYIEEKKQYTGILRSIIRNDILFLVAINAKNEIDIFKKYEEMLKHFSIFEHIIFDDIGGNIKFDIDGVMHTLKLDLEESLNYYLNKYLNENIYKHDKLKERNIFNNNITLKYSFLYELMREFSTWQYDFFKKNLMELINTVTFSSLMGRNNNSLINSLFTENSFYLYEGDEVCCYESGSIIKNGKIIDAKNSISLIEGAYSIINGKINLGSKCISLNKRIFFHKSNNANYNDCFFNIDEVETQCCKIIKTNILNNLSKIEGIYFTLLNDVVSEINKTDFFKKMNEKLKIDSTGTILFE